MATFGQAHQGNFYIETNVVLKSQNVANNQSVVEIGVWFNGKNGGSVNASFTTSIAINGTNVDVNTAQRSIGANGAGLFGVVTRTLDHGADGKLTVTISGTVLANNIIAFHQTSGGSYTLPTIPRATTPTWSADWFLTGAAKMISLPRASSSFTHDVTYKFGTKSGTIATGAGVTASWTPPHTLLTEIPNAEYGSGTITVVTKNGSTQVGSKSVTFHLSAASVAVPTVNAVTWTDANTVVKNNIGAFVQGLSVISGTFTASGYEGSTIKTRRILLGANETPLALNTAFSIADAGTVTAKGEATDSRGRTTKRAANFTVLAYDKPALGSGGFKVQRANSSNVVSDQGTYLRIDLHVLAKSLQVSNTEKNGLTIAVRTRPTNGSWTNRNTITHGITHNAAIQVSGGAAFAITSSYEVEVTVTDKCGEQLILKKVVSSAAVTIHMKGNDVAIGKYWERGALDVAGDLYASGNIYQNSQRVVDQSMSAKNMNYASATGRTYWGTGQTATNAGSTYMALSPIGGNDEDFNRLLWVNSGGSERFRIFKDSWDVQIYGRLISTHNAWAEAAGTLTHNSDVPANGFGGNLTVVFPTGRFTQPPKVFTSSDKTRTSTTAGILVTTTGFRFDFHNWTAGAQVAPIVFGWHAVQMSSGNANG